MLNIRHISLSKAFFSSKKEDEKKSYNKKKRRKRLNCLKSYCLSEYVLRVIDEPDTCGLIERRGTSC
jgi:hypothetical protein